MSPFWHNRLFLTGCSAELNAVLACLMAHTDLAEQLHPLLQRALSSQHAKMLGNYDRNLQPITFRKLFEPPNEVLGTNEAEHWFYSYWGTAPDLVFQAKTSGPNEISYRFQTHESVPAAAIQFLSAVFPSLGVAHYFMHPDLGSYCRTYRGGKLIQDRNNTLQDTEARDTDYVGRHDPPIPTQDLDKFRANLMFVDPEAPLETITNSVITEIRRVNSDTEIDQLHDRLQSLGLSAEGAYTLLARHARRISGTILSGIMEYSPAGVAFSLRNNIPYALATSVAHAVAQRLLTEKVPQTQPKFAEKNDDLRVDWKWKIYAWRRIIISCVRAHPTSLSNVNFDLAFQRFQDLDPKDDFERSLYFALAEIFVLSNKTPAHVLEAIRPPQPSRLLDLLAAHPNISVSQCIKCLQLPLGVPAQAAVAFNPRLTSQENVVRAMLQRECTWSHVPYDGFPHVHPYPLCALAVHAPVSQLPAILEAFADHPQLLLDVIETLPAERRTWIPIPIWAKLLNTNDRALRQRAMLVLGTFAAETGLPLPNTSEYRKPPSIVSNTAPD